MFVDSCFNLLVDGIRVLSAAAPNNSFKNVPLSAADPYTDVAPEKDLF